MRIKILMEKKDYGEKCRITCYERKTIDLRRCRCLSCKKEIWDCATRFQVKVIFVASYKNMMNDPEGKWVYVDAVKEAADLYIINAVKKGDLVITNDIGLAGT